MSASAPSPPAPPLPAAPSPVEEALRSRARRFEPQVLYRLLQRLFPGRPIRLRSKPSLAPEPTAVDAVDFKKEGPITLTLNIGLRSSTSPLPSYFRDLESDPQLGEALCALLDQLDDGLLRARLEASDAGESDWLVGGGRALGKDLSAIARLATPSGLWWLFSRVFPELAVSVRRGVLGSTLVADEARVGFAMLGSAMLGGSFAAPLPGYDVVLRITPVDTWTEEVWATEAARRLPLSAWPALAGTEVPLRVWLVDPRGGAALALGAGKVGVETLATASRPDVKLIFEGHVPDPPDEEEDGSP